MVGKMMNNTASNSKIPKGKSVFPGKKPSAKAPAKPKSKTTGAKLSPVPASRGTRTAKKKANVLSEGLQLDPKPSKEQPVITNESIALRAYYIAERRHKMGWHGDSHSDWIQATEQLRAEALQKPLKKR
jgi:hypothetical protein